MDAEYWRRQALEDLIPRWQKRAVDAENGGFFMNLSRDWRPIPPWDKVPALIGRHVFGFSAAFLLSGKPEFLDLARGGVDYLFRRGWDDRYGGWYDRLSKDGTPLVETKSVANRLYTDVGLTEYFLATGDSSVLSRIHESVAIQRTRARDDEFGGYAQTLGRDLAVVDYGKNKHAHYGYVGSLLLNLYLATGEREILDWSRELLDLSLDKLTDGEGWFHGFRSRFDRHWVRTPNVVGGKEVVSVGAELTAALALLRFYHQSGDEKYLRSGKLLGDRLIERAFDAKRGAWPELIETKAPYRVTAEPVVWWWVQIYGSFLQLQLYRVTGEDRYLETFRKSEEFFENYLRDRENGGIFSAVTPEGRLVGEGRKASDSEWHTSYHEMEHALLNYLYLNLYVHRAPAVLHFRLDGPGSHLVSPVDDPAVTVSSVKMDGKPWTDFDAGRRLVTVPGGRGHAVEVTLAPGPRGAGTPVPLDSTSNPRR
jgi:mannobiose 2-epimerase